MCDLGDLVGLGGYTPDQWQAFGTMLTALIAIAAAVFAWQQVGHARKLREEQAQPMVVVDIERNIGVGSPFLDFVVFNYGSTIAYDVKIKFMEDVETTVDEHGLRLRDSKLLTEGIPTLPPGRKIAALFENSVDRYQREDLPHSYEVEVTYCDSNQKQYGPYKYRLDFGVLYGLMHLTEYGTHQGVKALREIEKTVKKWTDGPRGGLGVFTRDGEAKDRQRAAEYKRQFAAHEALSARLLGNRLDDGSIISESIEQQKQLEASDQPSSESLTRRFKTRRRERDRSAVNN